MECLWCQEAIMPEVNWATLVQLSPKRSLCPGCEEEMERIHGKRCPRCSKVGSDAVCRDCSWWEERMPKETLAQNYSVFSYNARMKEMIAKWKYRGDYHLGHAFKQHVKTAFADWNFSEEAIAVPIPLSEERLQERGFNQAKMLASFLPLETEEVLTRLHGEKQSKKTREERILTENPFVLEKALHKPVVLVDDIYTTGTTLRHAGALLHALGCPAVYAFTLIRG
ncbi:ComF family protein [Lentibacillus sediminis]|uniref:ComF family protein n=1 Tax=Lentibacillus sediminis TaxID=1940529 RepID=UPI000C1C7D31|nr:ComF family protein [Lentibacillus sediminis]